MPTIACYELAFAVDCPHSIVTASGKSTFYRYEAAQGIVMSLLRHADPDRATALHDANERKALSISPVAIQALPGGLSRGTLRLCSWDPDLVVLVDAALGMATEARLDLGKTPALLIGWNTVGTWEVDDFLATPASDIVRVRFASPTRFGFGRHPNGSARAHLVPDPGPVVASWLRAWRLTGDCGLDWLPNSPEELGRIVALVEMRDVRTEIVIERTAALTGFVGECVYCWQGRESTGQQALAMLARFAEVCGTGSKTGRGFGQTIALGAGPLAQRAHVLREVSYRLTSNL